MKKTTVQKAIVLTAMSLALTAGSSLIFGGCSKAPEDNQAIVAEVEAATKVEKEVENLIKESEKKETSKTEVKEENKETSKTEVKEEKKETSKTKTEVKEEKKESSKSEAKENKKETSSNVDYKKYGQYFPDGTFRFDGSTDAEELPVGVLKEALLAEGEVYHGGYKISIGEYKGHKIAVYDWMDENDIESICDSTGNFIFINYGLEYFFDMLIYDIDGNAIDIGYNDQVFDTKVEDGVTYVDLGYNYSVQTWVPFHNVKDYEEVYKKYVKGAVQDEVAEGDAFLKSIEHVWNRYYYTICYDPSWGDMAVYEVGVFLNDDGTVTYVDRTVEEWTKDCTAEEANALYAQLIEEHGAGCVDWWYPEFGNDPSWDEHTHEWDPHGDPNLRCRTLEEHNAK